jgi:D-alanyl-D-alanine carboxypeptidase
MPHPVAGPSPTRWRDRARVVELDLTEAQYRASFQAHIGDHRLLDVQGYELDGTLRFATVWAFPATGCPRQMSSHELTAQDWAASRRARFRPVRLCGYVRADELRYVAVWQYDATQEAGVHRNAWRVELDVSEDALKDTHGAAREAGYELTDVSTWRQPGTGTARFAAIWTSPPLPPERLDRTSAAGSSLEGPIAIAPTAGEVRMADPAVRILLQAVTPATSSSPASVVTGGLPWRRGRTAVGRRSGTVEAVRTAATGGDVGRLGVHVTATSPGATRLAPVRTVWDDRWAVPDALEDIRQRWSLPALSVAVAKDDRWLGSWGVGDVGGRRPTPGPYGAGPSSDPTVTDTRFRIASVSKPVTAAAVMVLVEQGRLELEDPVFGRTLLGSRYPPPTSRFPRSDITVRHLLQHSPGWVPGRGQHVDPIFDPAHLTETRDQLIAHVLTDYEVAVEPGTTFRYWNMNYCLLGRVIENVTGRPYEQAVRALVLDPCGATDMRIGGTAPVSGEAVYAREDGGYDPYALDPHRMDAHGGWVATARDLVRFATRCDALGPTTGDATPVPGAGHRDDLISPAGMRTMTTPTGPDPGYALGWVVGPPEANRSDRSWNHNGSMPGTMAQLTRTPDGFCWAVLANARPEEPAGASDACLAELDRCLWELHARLPVWNGLTEELAATPRSP